MSTKYKMNDPAGQDSLVDAMRLNQAETPDDEVPRGFLNYILFDENMTFITSGFVQLSSLANTQWETVQFSDPLVIDADGYCMLSHLLPKSVFRLARNHGWEGRGR